MKRIHSSLYLIALVISVISINSGCKKEGIFCEKGKGSVITETRNVAGFTSIEQDMNATLYVSQGNEYSVKVEAQGNLMDAILTEVKGSELRIYSDQCIRKYDPIKVYVTMPEVNGISLGGSGSVIIQTRVETSALGISVAGSGSIIGLDSVISPFCSANIAGSGSLAVFGTFEELETRIAGSGSITLKGTGNSNSIAISGSGDVHACELEVKTCNIEISGSGNAEVNATEHLDVSISGSGDVFYKGSPTITTNTSGSGSLQHVP